MVIDSQSISVDVTTSEKNNLAIEVERKELTINIELEKKFYLITKGASTLAFFNSFKKMSLANIQNANILYNFIITEQNHTNVKLSTRLTYIKVICLFNRYLSYKDFTKITKNDILDYLNSLKRSESDDPTHKWINTYNTRQAIFSKFFRWLYNQDEPDHKKRKTPTCINAIRQLVKKEVSSYKPSDIWTSEDHILFLKYCPEKRDKCYHAMALDTSARPHELLSLRIKDIKFRVSTIERQFAEVHIEISKTKPRTLPLIHSLPYVKDWIDSHPMKNNTDTFLFISLADCNFGEQLSENALYKLYTRKYKKGYFPKLVSQDSTISEVDKSWIRNLLTKPWNPYIIRHSGLTEKSKEIPEYVLKQYAGWSKRSEMPERYIHYFGNESLNTIL
ncbi:MAG TPA: tyrosine-type recombinase/integrase, partial [Nitrososphaeraceae archaeon]|nr:tyrosine-type recombinase/integrase [Nitrososphaeraceae archaeon]